LNQHRVAKVRRVPQLGGSVLAACDHRASQGHPDGATFHRRTRGVRHASGSSQEHESEDRRRRGGRGREPAPPPVEGTILYLRRRRRRILTALLAWTPERSISISRPPIVRAA